MWQSTSRVWSKTCWRATASACSGNSAGEDHAREGLGAGDVGALADVDEERAGADLHRLETGSSWEGRRWWSSRRPPVSMRLTATRVSVSAGCGARRSRWRTALPEPRRPQRSSQRSPAGRIAGEPARFAAGFAAARPCAAIARTPVVATRCRRPCAAACAAARCRNQRPPPLPPPVSAAPLPAAALSSWVSSAAARIGRRAAAQRAVRLRRRRVADARPAPVDRLCRRGRLPGRPQRRDRRRPARGLTRSSAAAAACRAPSLQIVGPTDARGAGGRPWRSTAPPARATDGGAWRGAAPHGCPEMDSRGPRAGRRWPLAHPRRGTRHALRRILAAWRSGGLLQCRKPRREFPFVMPSPTASPDVLRAGFPTLFEAARQERLPARAQGHA